MDKECWKDMEMMAELGRALYFVVGFIYTFWWVWLPKCDTMLQAIGAFIGSVIAGWLVMTYKVLKAIYLFLDGWQI